MKEYKDNKYTVRLTDTMSRYINEVSEMAGISAINYIRMLIAQDMQRGDRDGYINPQK